MKSKNLKWIKLKLKDVKIYRSTNLHELREIKNFYERFKTEDLELLLADMDAKHEDYKQVGLLVPLLAFFIALLTPFTNLFGVTFSNIIIYYLCFAFLLCYASFLYSTSLRKATLQKNIIKNILENRVK